MKNAIIRTLRSTIIYALAIVGLWYVGTSAALMQFGLTIEEAKQIGAVSQTLPDIMEEK